MHDLKFGNEFWKQATSGLLSPLVKNLLLSYRQLWPGQNWITLSLTEQFNFYQRVIFERTCLNKLINKYNSQEKKSLNWAISKKKKNFFSHSFPKCDNLQFSPFLLSSFTKCACVIASLTDTEPSLHIHFIFMPFNLNYFMMQNVVMKGCLIAWNIWQCNRCQ